jgi:hypothetical protein
MKSVLHIGINAPSHSPKGIEKGFRQAGFTGYNFFDWQSCRFNEGILGTQSRMIAAAQSVRPDIIFCQFQNSDICDEETAIELSKCGFTVNYSFDVRSLELTEWMYDLAPHFGLTLFACQEDVDEANRRGIYNVGVLQSSVDFDVYSPPEVRNTRPNLKWPSVVFVGNNYVGTSLNFPLAQERLDMVKALKEMMNGEFNVQGQNWDHSRMIHANDEVLAYRNSIIGISHNNYDRTMYTSDRLWRIMGCGLFCLTKYFHGVEAMFEQGVHLDWWHDIEELKSKIFYYLSEAEEREAIAKAGCLFVRENHGWVNRVQEMLHLIEVTKAMKHYGQPATK